VKGKRYLTIPISAAALLILFVMLSASTCGSNSTPSATSTAKATATPAASGLGTGTSTPPAPTGSPTVAVATNPSLGKILVNAQGMTLYRSDKDTSGTSNCTGTCAQVWPPLAAGGGAPQGGTGVTGNLGVITRADQTKQITYNGAPLYSFNTDTKPGDATGDGVNGFHVVTP